MSPDRKALLDKLNFHWQGTQLQANQAAWNKHYRKLKAFHKKYGHSIVPSRWKEDKSLASWVANQKQNHDRLSLQRKKRLEALDFKWPYEKKKEWDELWMKNYRQLLAFKRKNGHLNISPKLIGVKLMNWANKQKKRKMALWREELLNDIDFSWKAKTKREPWDDVYKRLVAFYKEYGHSRVPKKMEGRTQTRSLGK